MIDVKSVLFDRTSYLTNKLIDLMTSPLSTKTAGDAIGSPQLALGDRAECRPHHVDRLKLLVNSRFGKFMGKIHTNNTPQRHKIAFSKRLL